MVSPKSSRGVFVSWYLGRVIVYWEHFHLKDFYSLFIFVYLTVYPLFKVTWRNVKNYRGSHCRLLVRRCGGLLFYHIGMFRLYVQCLNGNHY